MLYVFARIRLYIYNYISVWLPHDVDAFHDNSDDVTSIYTFHIPSEYIARSQKNRYLNHTVWYSLICQIRCVDNVVVWHASNAVHKNKYEHKCSMLQTLAFFVRGGGVAGGGAGVFIQTIVPLSLQNKINNLTKPSMVSSDVMNIKITAKKITLTKLLNLVLAQSRRILRY